MPRTIRERLSESRGEMAQTFRPTHPANMFADILSEYTDRISPEILPLEMPDNSDIAYALDMIGYDHELSYAEWLQLRHIADDMFPFDLYD